MHIVGLQMKSEAKTKREMQLGECVERRVSRQLNVTWSRMGCIRCRDAGYLDINVSCELWCSGF